MKEEGGGRKEEGGRMEGGSRKEEGGGRKDRRMKDEGWKEEVSISELGSKVGLRHYH